MAAGDERARAAVAAVRRKESPRMGAARARAAVAALCRGNHLQRQMRGGGGQHQVVRAVQDACEPLRQLRRGADDEALRQLITRTWAQRTDRYSLDRHDGKALPGRKIEMSYIGG